MELVNNTLDTVDNVYSKVGAKTPASRFGVTAAVVGGIIYLTGHSAFFRADGSLREWNMMSDSDEATSMPLWLVAVVSGLAVALFV